MLGLVFTASSVAFAQQPGTATQDNGQQQEQRPERRGRREGMGKEGPRGMGRLMSQLNLTDAQRQQLRALEERFEASTKAQRDELRRLHESTQGEPSADAQARFQALRAELGEARKAQHQEVLNVLTAEQRAQLEQLVKERRDRHGDKRGRRMEQQNNDDDNNNNR
jgi:Spy/CpxP family protein refolding chaperone